MAFLVCPVLGPIAHRKNWLALGYLDEARKSQAWAWIFGALMVGWQIAVVLSADALAAWPLYIVLFAVWYWTLARKQSKLMQQDLVGAYRKKSFIPAAFLGIAGTVALILVTNAIRPTLVATGGGGPKAEVNNETTTDSKSVSNRLALAKNATEQIVLKSLKSPSTARFSGFKIVENSGDFFLTFTSVDSQNGFGAMVRSHFITVFKLEGEKFIYDTLSALEEVASPEAVERPNMDLETTIVVQKRQIKWPGSEKEVEDEKPKNTSATHSDKGSASTAKEESRTGEENAATYLKAREEEAKQIREKLDAEGARLGGKDGTMDRTPAAPGGSNTPGGDARVRLATAKSELAALETRMESERKRYSDALALINRETANKTKAVTQGSAAYYRCLEASKIVQEVEGKAPEMKAEKARLETLVKLLESAQ
ncbi:hypothetical protein [Luteolibacter sp. LG18]|uniref:hypothetical protein n=1 Tax=Luteolibacter sp. LG18 TaxID=2819286 RepID=UPI002B2AF523|nr:hypothetical protein llg_11200 [Luteolibacter sp. LG18]